MGKDTPDNLDSIRRDDRNLEIARNRWEQDTEDPAVELLKKIREDVEE